MRVGDARAHLRCHPDRFHDLLFCRAKRNAAFVWPRIQYGHCVTWATATGINCFVVADKAPSANTFRLNAWKASWISGAIIQPDECIDCGVCAPECPAEAILPDSKPGLDSWLKLNADYAAIWPKSQPRPSLVRCERIRRSIRKIGAVFFTDPRARRLRKYEVSQTVVRVKDVCSILHRPLQGLSSQ